MSDFEESDAISDLDRLESATFLLEAEGEMSSMAMIAQDAMIAEELRRCYTSDYNVAKSQDLSPALIP